MEQSDSSPGASFDWQSVAPGDEHYQLALTEYCAGRTFLEIVTLLEERGLAVELIPEVTTAVAKDRAVFLLLSGKPPAAVRAALVERGLSPKDAKDITRAANRSRERAHSSLGVGKWGTRSLVIGGLLMMTGFVLYALRRFGVADLPTELVVGLMGGGVLLAGFGGAIVTFDGGAG